MTDNDMTLLADLNVQISRQRFDALLLSHEALREIVIKVTDVLQEPSRLAKYRASLQGKEYGLDDNYTITERANSKSDPPGPPQQKGKVVNFSRLRQRDLEKNEPFLVQDSASAEFEKGNFKARVAYRRKRMQSFDLFAYVPGSYVATEHDFQCRVIWYSNE